jgi:[histone H3]-lysine4 N-trimethyltransferase SETD1
VHDGACDDSKQPNAYAKVVSANGVPKIIIFAKKTIKAHTEITYDYQFPIEDEKIPCHCGADTCTGYLN